MWEDRNNFRKYMFTEFSKHQTEVGRKIYQNEFAEWLGISEGSMSHYMKGERIPNHDTLALLAIKQGPQVYDAA